MDKKPLKNSFPGKSDRCEHSFTHLNHQDNTLERSLENFETRYCIYLRNSGIYKHTSKQTISLNNQTEVENAKFTLV